MVQTLSRVPAPVVTSVVRATCLCLADVWGYSHPIPPATVELIHRGPVPPRSGPLLQADSTERDGSFAIATQHDLRRFPWSLRLVNDVTGQTYVRNSEQVVTAPKVEYPVPGAVNVEFDIGRIFLPWDPMLSTLATIGSRKFVYPTLLAHALGVELHQQQSTVSLLYEFDLSNPVRDRSLDDMFRTLAAASSAGTTTIPDLVATEVARVLGINTLTLRKRDQIFGLALQRIEMMSVREVRRQMYGYSLGKALQKAIGAATLPITFLDAFAGLAAAAVLIFAAGHIARQHTMSVHLSGVVSMAIPNWHRHYKSIDLAIP